MPRATRLLSFVALPLGTLMAQAAGAAPEREMVRYVDAHRDSAIALLERVVNINSGTMNVAGVRAVGAVFRAQLDALGFHTRWEDGSPYRRAGHLIAERAGPGPHILLIGHLDTVFEPDSPFQRFERLDAATARGPGISDMKGGDVIMVLALQALHAAGVLDRLHLTVVLHGDEEESGEPLSLARRTLIDAARSADIAIGFEDGDGDPATAVASRRGVTTWRLHVTGTPAHSSQIFHEDVGAGAVFEAARVLEAFRTRLAGQQLLTFSPGIALGGTTVELDSTLTRGTAAGKTNVVAGAMDVVGDLRAFTPGQLAAAQAAMREVVAAPLSHTSSELTFDEGYPPMAPTDGNRRLLALYDLVSRDLGFGPVGQDDPARAGAADISYAAAHVAMALDGIGLGGRDGHTAHETGDLTSLPLQAKRAAVLLYRLSVRPPVSPKVPD